MSASTIGKPAGGIAAVILTPAGNILRVSGAAGEEAEVELRDPGRVCDFPLAEEGSSYEEAFDADAGPLRVRHTLRLAAGREAESRTGSAEFLRAAAGGGLAALVTMRSGRRLLVGWSHRFGAEQPLRPVALLAASGSRPLDKASAVLTLASEDAGAAVEIKTQTP